MLQYNVYFLEIMKESLVPWITNKPTFSFVSYQISYFVVINTFAIWKMFLKSFLTAVGHDSNNIYHGINNISSDDKCLRTMNEHHHLKVLTPFTSLRNWTDEGFRHILLCHCSYLDPLILLYT